ncbi:MAG: 50S ribosomal protein L11 methyltransferase [Desulfomonilaceae bacterium]
MISPDTLLYIYEIQGDPGDNLTDPPPSFVGLWNEEGFSYLFFTKPEDQYVNDAICSSGLDLGARHEVRYGDWQTGLPPHGIQIAGLYFVGRDHPSPPPEAVILDPSVVFGDGSHPTTVRCLRFMREIIRSNSITSMLDLGTGSGMLALAAARMGVPSILAVDRNRLAFRTAKENIRANSLDAVIRVREGEARLFIDQPFDLVAANLPFHVLRELIPLRAAALHKFWIVSGINEKQAETLKELFSEQGYEIRGQAVDPPWLTFTAAKRCS